MEMGAEDQSSESENIETSGGDVQNSENSDLKEWIQINPEPAEAQDHSAFSASGSDQQEELEEHASQLKHATAPETLLEDDQREGDSKPKEDGQDEYESQNDEEQQQQSDGLLAYENQHDQDQQMQSQEPGDQVTYGTQENFEESQQQHQYYHQHPHPPYQDHFHGQHHHHHHPHAERPIDMSLTPGPGNCCPQVPFGYPCGDADPNLPKPTGKIVNGKRVGVKPVNPKFDRTKRFPEKLYAAACDPHIDFIRWSATGKAIIVNERQFEERVMHVCPELVQCESFDNFRRQLREYCFECRYINMPYQYDYEFIHPNFQYQREELLAIIKTRRRMIKDEKEADTTAVTDDGTPLPPRKRYKRKSSSSSSSSSSQSQTDLGSCRHACQHHQPQVQPQHYHYHHPQCQHAHNASQWVNHNHYASGDGSHCNMHMHANCSPVPWSPPSTPTNHMSQMHPSGSHSCGSLQSPHSFLHQTHSYPHSHHTSPQEGQDTSPSQFPTKSTSEMSLNPSPHSASHQSSKETSPLNQWQPQQHQHQHQHNCPSNNQMWGGYGSYAHGWNHHSCSPAFMQPNQYQHPDLSHQHYHNHNHHQMDETNSSSQQMSIQQDGITTEASNSELIYLQEPQVSSTPTTPLILNDGNSNMMQTSEPSAPVLVQTDVSGTQTVALTLDAANVNVEQVDITALQPIDPETLQQVDATTLEGLQQVTSSSLGQVDVTDIQQLSADEKTSSGSPLSTISQQGDTSDVAAGAYDGSTTLDTNSSVAVDTEGSSIECTDTSANQELDGAEGERKMIEVAQVHHISSNTQMLTNFTMLESGSFLDQDQSLQQQLQQQIAASH